MAPIHVLFCFSLTLMISFSVTVARCSSHCRYEFGICICPQLKTCGSSEHCHDKLHRRLCNCTPPKTCRTVVVTEEQFGLCDVTVNIRRCSEKLKNEGCQDMDYSTENEQILMCKCPTRDEFCKSISLAYKYRCHRQDEKCWCLPGTESQAAKDN